MPASSRSEVVRLGCVAVYHCWNRCVRRSRLCGFDPATNKDYEYRRWWIRDMQQVLASLFAVEIGFHAEMGNHMHLVMRTRPDIAQRWPKREVVRRWLTATKLAKSRDGKVRPPLAARIKLEMMIPGRVAKLRKRMADPSWFMSILSEYVARRSNLEDDCGGSFWEDRYGCRALLSEASVLVCGIYIDLNQIRAGEACTPETSRHTSAFDRIQLFQKSQSACDELPAGTPRSRESSPADWLCELTVNESMSLDDPSLVSSASGRRASDKGLLSISLESYLKLLDTSGRLIRDDKSGSIPPDLAPILDRLGIRREMWSELVTGYDQLFGKVVGSPAKVAERARSAGRRWYRGITNCAAAFV